MRGLTGDQLLRLPVRLHGIRLGRAVDVLLHPTEPQALGVDVLCRDHTHRFLPFSAASLGSDAIEPGSPFVLLDLKPGSFYRNEARALSDLRGARLAGGGALKDIVLGSDWSIEQLVVEGADGVRRVPLDGIVLPPRPGR